MNLNKVLIMGRLTADPEVKTTPTGTQVATFSVATNRYWTDKTGNKKEEVEFHNVVLWGKQAAVAGQFLTKGGIVFVEGRLQTRSWQGKDGVTRRVTEVIGESIQLGPRSGGDRGGNYSAPSTSGNGGDDNFNEVPVIEIEDVPEIKPEDLPF
jgi:single-strand DNA-binding protein